MASSFSAVSVLVATVFLEICLADPWTTYYVVSNSSKCKVMQSCNCHNITYYAANMHLLEPGQFELIFHPGEHLLEQTFRIDGAHDFDFKLQSSENESHALVKCVEGVGFEFSRVKDVYFHRLHIQGCSRVFSHVSVLTKNNTNASSGLYFYNSSNLNLTFLHVSSTVGYGVFLRNVYGQILIIHSCFFDSHDSQDFHGGNMKISYSDCIANTNITADVTIQNTTVAHGKSTFKNFSSGILLLFKCPQITLSLTMDWVMLENNSGCNCTDNSSLYDPDPASKPYGGNMAIMFLSSLQQPYRTSKTSIKIKNSYFSEGLALRGGGLAVQYDRNSTNYTSGIDIWKCKFDNNVAFVDGGGIYFQQEKNIATDIWTLNIVDTSFNGNSVRTEYDAGIGLTLTYFYKLQDRQLMMAKWYRAEIKNCSFTSNLNQPVIYQAGKSENKTKVEVYSSGSAALYISQQPDRLHIVNSSFLDNNVTAVATFRSVINVAGLVNISNNTGYEGGGMVLCEASYIFIEKAAVLYIAMNTAMLSGGGIFAESQCVQKRPLCFYQIEKGRNRNITNQIFLHRNKAEYAGTQLYGGTVEDCHIPGVDHDIFFDLFHFNYSENDTSYIASDPLEICFCENERPECSIITHEANESIYSGESYNISLVVVGQYNGTVPGEVTYGILYKNMSREFPTGKQCETHAITVDSRNQEETLLLTVKNAHADYRLNLKKKLVKVSFKDTPLGFVFANNEYTCIARPDLSKYGFKCNIKKQQAIITGKRGTWLGSKNISGKIEFVVHTGCPLDYCKIVKDLHLNTSSSMFDSDQQCQNKRTGTLCGKCKPPMSLSLGTTNCRDCTHVSFPVTIGISALYAVLGLVVLIFLWMFNITITQATFSGFLFYANIFFVFREALTTSRKPETTLIHLSKYIFYVVIAPTNFATYVNSCLYNGLDMAGHIWINFLGALYMLTIAGAIVVVSKYSSWISNRLADNTIHVLATIIILSNAVIITSVIYALTPTILNYENISRTEYVLLYDGTVPYLSTKHIPLFIVGFLFGLFSVVFALVLLFVQPLQRYSHWKVLNWVNKLKPLLDAYSCPHIIKPNCRFWNGFLLVLRIILYIVFMFDKAYDNKSLFAITLGCLITLSLSWALGGVYTKRYLNILSASYILNIGILSLVILALSKDSAKDTAVAVSLIVTSVTFLGTLLYHIHKTVSKFNICRNLVYKVLPHQRGCSQMVNYIDISTKDKDEDKQRNKSVFKKCSSQKLSFSEYREPQLMDYDSPLM